MPGKVYKSAVQILTSSRKDSDGPMPGPKKSLYDRIREKLLGTGLARRADEAEKKRKKKQDEDIEGAFGGK